MKHAETTRRRPPPPRPRPRARTTLLRDCFRSCVECAWLASFERGYRKTIPQWFAVSWVARRSRRTATWPRRWARPAHAWHNERHPHHPGAERRVVHRVGPRHPKFAVAHCAAGDLLIAAACLLGTLLIAEDSCRPVAGFARVAVVALTAGPGYTIFSECLNLVRGSLTHADAMPIVPIFNVGLTPLLQWIVVPLTAFWFARRRRLPSRGS